jgi:outer membrane receptor protein involved in Fe transport
MDWLASLRRQIQPGAGSVSYAGYADQPRLTGLADVTWTIHDWSSTANLRYTGPYAYADHAGSPFDCPDELRRLGHCRTPAFTLLDLDFDYGGFAHWRLELHVRNVLDHRPHYGGHPQIDFNPAFDDVAGRYVLLGFRYRQ